MPNTTISTHRKTAPRYDLSDKKILLVDDEPIFRQLARNYLASQGATILEATDGKEGLRVLKQHDVDLVISDISMPIVNGFEFIEEVSMDYPSLPVIVVSGTEEISDVAQVLKWGVKDFLTKPLTDYTNLGEAVMTTLEDANSHVASGRDFASQWFHVEGGGELPEEKELYWHLKYLQEHPSAARVLLQAIIPENDSAQGAWRCSYRLLQPADMMPVVFDYVWLMNGQYAFYVLNSDTHPLAEKGAVSLRDYRPDSQTQDRLSSRGHSQNGIATALLVRALFHDYLRNLKCEYADLKDLIEVLEKGMACIDCASPIQALFGVANLTNRSLSILPAGLGCHWSNQTSSQVIRAGELLGENSRQNFTTQELPLGQLTQVSTSTLGVNAFTLNISRNTPD